MISHCAPRSNFYTFFLKKIQHFAGYDKNVSIVNFFVSGFVGAIPLFFYSPNHPASVSKKLGVESQF
jgi:hypothetical protein